MSSPVAHLLRPSLNWLLVFFPVAAVLEMAHARGASWASPTAVFICSALAIVPMAGWMGRATEHLAERFGEGVGGLLNATFGNAAELIIALMALIQAYREPEKQAAMHYLVKASLTGSIIGNVLLVLGAALLAGGLRYNVQHFNAAASRVSATLLNLATAALLIPAVFAYLVPRGKSEVGDISLELSVLLLFAYALNLVFALKTHRHLYAGPADVETAEPGDDEAPHAPWPVRRAIGVLLVATALVAVLAEFMIGSVVEASHAIGLTELFVGVIVVAIVGNAAEHSTAVLMALRNRMDLSLSIAIGSSIQIALFIAPVLVLVSHGMGMPLDLVFTVPEIMAVVMAATVMHQIAGDGQSNWFEGVLLLLLYAMLGLLFFHLPV
ncbi:MAG: calcium/proton exchanger [Pirellulales bacterium]|nr:calcium/proton exchanger [Pirellulales bacterium]